MVTVLLAAVHFLIALLPVVGDIDIARAVHRHAEGSVNPEDTSVVTVLLAAVHSLIALLPVSAI